MLIGGSCTNRKNRSIEFLDREKAVQTKLDDLDKKIILERLNSKGVTDA